MNGDAPHQLTNTKFIVMTDLHNHEAIALANVDAFDLNRYTALDEEATEKTKAGFEASLKQCAIVKAASDWYDTTEAQDYLADEGVLFDTKEDFFNRALSVSKGWAYKMIKVANLEPSKVREYKRNCTELEGQGERPERSVAALLKFAKGESQSTAKALATFSIAKDGLNGDGGFSIRITADGEIKQSGSIENENIDYNVQKLFSKLQQIFNNA